MNSATAFSAANLEQRLRAAEPGVVLAPPRILRRVIKKHTGVSGIGLQVPHRKSYVLRRDELFTIAGRDELDLPADRQLPEVVVLLPQPRDDQLLERTPEDILRSYWRLLFHARIHTVLQERRRDGALSAAALRNRLQRLGLTEFAEARMVLRQEHFLLPPGDTPTSYEELVAVYLELRYFAPEKLPRYFPGLDAATAERVFAEDVDADRLLTATRPEGVRTPTVPANDEFATVRGRQPAAPLPRTEVWQRQALLKWAERAEAKGNLVRAALCRTQAHDTLASVQTVQRLVERLRQAAGFPADEAADWQRGLTALLVPAAASVWPVEARLLVDLQSLCIDREQKVYATDLVEWIVSGGRKSIKRELPYQGDVLAVKHLRNAVGRLAAARVDDATRDLLMHHLHQALNRAEEHLRNCLRPVILHTLNKVDMIPANAAETVARNKLVEELLDLIVEHGYLNMSDLRDAIARNRLKMPNLSGPIEFFHGDRLIRANRRLAETLDGVYHRGEVYRRWLQRLTSVAFGTVVGRWLTLYIALPFGCAFVALGGLQEILHLVMKYTGLIEPVFHEGRGMVIYPTAIHLIRTWSVLLLGIFLLVMIHWPEFRNEFFSDMRALYRGGHFLLVELPVRLFHLPLLQAFFRSRLYLFVYHFLGKPLAYAAPVAVALYLLRFPPLVYLGAGGVVFLAMALLFNSPLGQHLEEIATDAMVRAWHLLSVDFFPGLFRWILFVFRRFTEDVERLIYTVDEWLRFRQGDRPWTFYVKVGLGLLWFCITYVVRFALNLLVEPQINPIKHFPVVTVSHKMLFPLIVPSGKGQASPLGSALMAVFPLSVARADMVAATIIWGIPGFFGFLVWELKENWKLYRANESPLLDAEVVCSHGETVLRLLRPGFHSGTLPKLYAKLRHARGRSLRVHKEALHHVAESLRHFVERTLLATLAGSKRWGLDGAVWVAGIQCGCNRIRVVVACPSLEGATLLLDLEELGGWLIAGVARHGWLAALNAEQSEAFNSALAGFYKRAGVDLVREQIAALLPPETLFTVTDAGLTVWLGEAEVRYDLSEEGMLHPTVVCGSPSSPPVLARKDVVFSETELRWSAWGQTWERDRADKETPKPVERMVLAR
jgi:hypothetical protein